MHNIFKMTEEEFEEYLKSKEFEDVNLKSAMCLAPDGSLPLSKICTPQRSGYDMCPTQKVTTQWFLRAVTNTMHQSFLHQRGVQRMEALDKS